MGNVFWPKTLMDLCQYYYHPGLHTLTEKDIIQTFLWQWGNYPEKVRPIWKSVFDLGQDGNGEFEKDVYPILVRAIDEGTERDRLFALFLLGGWGRVEGRDLLFSFLSSHHRKERWISGISLGRLKDDRVFELLQHFLLEEFSLFASNEEMRNVQKAFRTQRQNFNARKPFSPTGTFWDIQNCLDTEDYAWYLHQRSECAIILGNWRKPDAIPKLREAFKAAWKMEVDWPDFMCRDEEGPEIWQFYLDRLAFALGQLGAWDALSDLSLPEEHLLVARMYLTIGSLGIEDSLVFWTPFLERIFHHSFLAFARLTSLEKSANERYLIQISEHLGKYFNLTLREQETYIQNFLMAKHNRKSESGFTPLSSLTPEEVANFDPFEG